MDISVRTVLRYGIKAAPYAIGFAAQLYVAALVLVLRISLRGLMLCACALGHIFLFLWEGWDAAIFTKQRVRTYRPYTYASSAGTYDPRRGR